MRLSEGEYIDQLSASHITALIALKQLCQTLSQQLSKWKAFVRTYVWTVMVFQRSICKGNFSVKELKAECMCRDSTKAQDMWCENAGDQGKFGSSV